ncbi:energy-coupling factor transporter transmembrane component T family protein [Rothia nasimurium]|uniref:energy-coupling factor transporter transmembrane component T family protein n=1 Tax=Rothia nasimurium TaxID=85336 RepID=UPI003BA22594
MNPDFFAPTPAHTSRIGRLSAGSKLLATLVLSLGLVLIRDWVSAATILTLQLALFFAWGLNPLTLLARFWPLLIGTLLTGWSTSLIADKTGDTLLQVGFIWVTTDSATTGIALMIRSLALILPGILLITTTDPTDIADALAQTAKLPARFVLAALAALRLVTLMMSEWATLGQARRARGLGSSDSLLRQLKTVTGQGFALVVQSIRRGTRLATTMEARGFGAGARTWARTPVYGKDDLYFLLICLGILLAGYGTAAFTGTLTWVWM